MAVNKTNSKKDMGWNSESTTSNSLPRLKPEQQQPLQRLIGFREPVEVEAIPGTNRNTRRGSRLLPTVQRKNSLVAFEPMVAKFVKNGDKFFEGVQLNISPRVLRSWEVLLDELSQRIDLPAGVRRIYTPEGGTKINSLSELEHQKVYVCASTEPFKKINYKKVKNPDWKTSRSRPSEIALPSVFSKSFPGDLNTSFASTASSNPGGAREDVNVDTYRSIGRRMSRIRRPSRPMRLSSITEVDASFISANSTTTNAAPSHPLSPTTSSAKPTAITVYQNGPPPRRSVMVYLKREAIRSWEEAKKLVGENLPNSPDGCLRLYRPDGEEVQSLSQLWRAGNLLIAAGKEKFDIADFMVGAGAPVPSLNQLQPPSATEKPTGTALPIRGTTSTSGAGTEVAESNGQISEPAVAACSCECVAEEAEQTTHTRNSNVEGGKKKESGKESASVQCLPERGDEARMEPVHNNNRIPTKDADKSDEEADRVVRRTIDRKASTTEESDLSSSLRATASDQSDSERAKQLEIQTASSQRYQSDGDDSEQERRNPSEPSSAIEVHPEEKAKPSIGFADPAAISRPVSESITPAVSPDEEEELPARSGRPRTLSFISEKYAGLLSQSYRPGSTSSSSDIESPLYAARKKLLNQRGFPNPLVQPQTPQSEISLGICQSVVDMLLPRPIGSGSDLDTGASTPSSEAAHQTRNIGIQTQYEDNRLSSVFESDDQQPIPKPKDHTRLVNVSKWMVESQTELALKSLSLSQSTDAFLGNKHRRDKYHIGMTLSEGHFATVKQCEEKATGKEHVLRVINKAKVFGREDLILREVTIMKMLRQENVMQVLDHWETTDDMYLIIEQIEGSDLFDAILNCQHFCEVDAAIAVRQLGTALVYLHANQIVHRDVKPENIFMTLDPGGGWMLKLGGFGLAAVATEPLSFVCGNQYYRAPEMISEIGYGTKLDVWAAGVVTYLIICGSLPFGRKSRTSLTSNTLFGKISFPSCYWSHISKEAKDFVKHLMKVSPSQRYSSSEMLQHPWINDVSNLNRPQSLESTKLLDYLKSKASISPKVTSVPVLTVTALDHRGSSSRLRHTSTNNQDT